MAAIRGALGGALPVLLFAVALGLQERSRSAVLRAFVPIALGALLIIVFAPTLRLHERGGARV